MTSNVFGDNFFNSFWLSPCIITILSKYGFIFVLKVLSWLFEKSNGSMTVARESLDVNTFLNIYNRLWPSNVPISKYCVGLSLYKGLTYVSKLFFANLTNQSLENDIIEVYNPKIFRLRQIYTFWYGCRIVWFVGLGCTPIIFFMKGFPQVGFK